MAKQFYFMYAGHRYDIGRRFKEAEAAERYIQKVYYGFGVKKKLDTGEWAVGRMVHRGRR